LPIEAAQARAVQEDDLLPKAIALVQQHKRASTSMLQRQLRIGYSRAARLMEAMEKRGIIEPEVDGNRSRRVIVDGPGRDPESDDLPPL